MSKVRVPPVMCQVDGGIARVEVGDFRFPLGVYPVEPMDPSPGYTEDFEPADGADTEGDWEEWPDRYVFDIVLSAQRLPALGRLLFAMLPPRVYPILDILGHDAYREVDPYISYERIGLDRFLDGVERFGPFLYEDGLCGFGAMCDDPFFYVFVDEHKVVTIRCEPGSKERLEQILGAFDLGPNPEAAGADSSPHEHRGVLGEQEGFLGPDDVIEHLRGEWRLTLNIDTEANEDDEGTALGLTYWRCVVREHAEEGTRRAEVFLSADCYAEAEMMSVDTAEALEGRHEESDLSLIQADRLTGAMMAELLGSAIAEKPENGGIIRAGWIE